MALSRCSTSRSLIRLTGAYKPQPSRYSVIWEFFQKQNGVANTRSCSVNAPTTSYSVLRKPVSVPWNGRLFHTSIMLSKKKGKFGSEYIRKDEEWDGKFGGDTNAERPPSEPTIQQPSKARQIDDTSDMHSDERVSNKDDVTATLTPEPPGPKASESTSLEPPPAPPTVLPYSLQSYPSFIRRLSLSLPHLHRPTRDELLNAATSFWQRMRIRFKWSTIRSFRKFDADDMSAFFTWFLMSQMLWIFIGT